MCKSCIENKLGRLELIVGCMFAGKTEEFLRRIRRLKYAKMKFVIFKPEIDNRYLKKSVVSHNLNSIECKIVKNSNDISNYLNENKNIEVIAIDEVQFFDNKIVSLINSLVEDGKVVIATGLDLDYKAEPFKNTKDLLPIAEYVTKLHAVCIKCGSLASRTKRILTSDSKENKNRILIGSTESYEARCRSCYKKD